LRVAAREELCYASVTRTESLPIWVFCYRNLGEGANGAPRQGLD